VKLGCGGEKRYFGRFELGAGVHAAIVHIWKFFEITGKTSDSIKMELNEHVPVDPNFLHTTWKVSKELRERVF
jgi:predicted secreted Zn-dependent protease